MHIVVLVKRVPDTASKIKVGGDGKSIDEAGLQFVLNPYDEYAVEAALKLAEKANGTVTVLTMGPADAQAQLRTALAMGATQGLHIEDKQALRDPASLAKTLASAIKTLNPAPSLVLAGRQAADSQGLAIGPMVATYLGMPCVTDIIGLEVEGQTAKVKREAEGGHESLEVGLPALLTTNKGLNEPRYASLKGIMAAKKKPITAAAVAIAPEKTAIVKMSEPLARKGGRIVGEGAAAVPALVKLLREEAKAL